MVETVPARSFGMGDDDTFEADIMARLARMRASEAETMASRAGGGDILREMRKDAPSDAQQVDDLIARMTEANALDASTVREWHAHGPTDWYCAF